MKHVLKTAALIGGLICPLIYNSAFAATAQGAYVNVLGGIAYLNASELKSVQVGNLQAANPSLNPNFNSGSVGFAGRTAVGYYYYSNPLTSWAYGLELGYDYLSPINSSTSAINQPYFVKSNAKVSAQSGDLDYIFNKSFSARFSAFGKLGLAYEAKTEAVNYTSQVVGGSPGSPVNSNNTKNVDGYGVLGGLGLQYSLSKHVSLQTEFDLMKGENGVGYAQALAGLSFSF